MTRRAAAAAIFAFSMWSASSGAIGEDAEEPPHLVRSIRR